MKYQAQYMQQAIDWAQRGRDGDGGPFGCVIVKGDTVIAACHNEVSISSDCTQHAELRGIQQACEKLKSKTLEGCELYTSCVPCMMCLGAMRWANLDTIYYGASAEDACKAGFVYANMYYAYDAGQRDAEFNMIQKMREEAVAVWS